MKRYPATTVILLALSVSLCAQTAQNSVNNGAPIQSTNTYPAQSTDNVSQAVYLPSGLDVQVRVNESISSGTAQAGDTFTGTLMNSIEDYDNNIIFARGTQVTGRVISVKPSGRLSDSGELVLSLNTIRNDKQVANVTVATKTLTGASHAGSNTAKVGGGALLGAIIGGLAGGGKGAAIGAGVGAGAGAGTAAATGKKEAKVDPESIVRFVTTTETTVVQVGSEAAREMERQPSVYQSGSGPRDKNAPVLRRRNSDANASPDGNVYAPQPTTQTAGNTPNDNDVPVMRRRENSGSDVNQNPQPSPNTPNATPGTTNPDSNTVSNPSADVSASTSTQWGFSARDKRVINSCLADNPGSVPAADANAIPYYKGDTLPYAAQKKIRSLPLACERQLPTVATDQERVIYNQQVLLVNSNNLVLDSFGVPKQ